jgi:hypothetical protein
MNNLAEKIRKIESIIKVRKIAYMDELNQLTKIRNEKSASFQAMKLSQQKYHQGVENLNKVRSSPNRENLEILEGSVDFLKIDWFNRYKTFKSFEQKESQQLQRFLEVEKSLKSLEKISENFRANLQSEIRKIEQKLSDEHTIISKTSRNRDIL